MRAKGSRFGRPGPDDPVLDRFPRDDERDFTDAVANFTTLKQHELEHSATAPGQLSPDPVIKAEAKIINGLLKAIAPYQQRSGPPYSTEYSDFIIR